MPSGFDRKSASGGSAAAPHPMLESLHFYHKLSKKKIAYVNNLPPKKSQPQSLSPTLAARLYPNTHIHHFLPNRVKNGGKLLLLSRIQSYLESNRTQTYTYGNLAEHKVFLTKGSGISFSLPPELLPKNQSDPRQTKAGQTNFTHTITARNGRPVFITRQSVFVGTFSNQNFDLDGTLKDPNNKEYKPFTESLTKIVESQNGAKNVVFSGSPGAFTNQNIKANAWTINFTGQLAQPSQAGKNDKLKGVILVAKGIKGTSYQLSIATIENNWQPNERTWQRILDSVKIDQ